MAEFEKLRNRTNKGPRLGARSASLIGREERDCGPGRKWVPPYRKSDGTYVKGHCAEIVIEKKWDPVEKRTRTTYGLKPFPHIERSTEIVEKPHDDGMKDAQDDEHD